METFDLLREHAEDYLGSYRTYEEWKPHLTIELSKFFQVLTVPMRNGNLSNKIKIPLDAPLVLTVPMRNGNDNC